MGNTTKQDIQQHREHRHESMAHIRIHGFDGYALLRNIHNGGFCIASKTYVSINRNEIHKMSIIPEAEAHIPGIELEVDVRWTRTSEAKFAAGFQIIQSNASLRAYLAYLEKMHKTDSPGAHETGGIR
jgi:hypothetical protein